MPHADCTRHARRLACLRSFHDVRPHFFWIFTPPPPPFCPHPINTVGPQNWDFFQPSPLGADVLDGSPLILRGGEHQLPAPSSSSPVTSVRVFAKITLLAKKFAKGLPLLLLPVCKISLSRRRLTDQTAAGQRVTRFRKSPANRSAIYTPAAHPWFRLTPVSPVSLLCS